MKKFTKSCILGFVTIFSVTLLRGEVSGQQTWAVAYGTGGNEGASSIRQTSDGGYIVAGGTFSFGTGNDDIWVIKLDSSGEIAWQKTYGGNNYEESSSIQQTSDGGYILAGITDSFGAGGQDLWVLKLDTDGNINSWCTFINNSTGIINDTTTAASSSSFSMAESNATVSDPTAIVTISNGSSTLICNNNIALISHKPAIDDSAGSTPNSIIETDEAVDLIGNIENMGAINSTSVTGHLTTVDPIIIDIANVTYPDIVPGTSEYSLTNYNITAPLVNRPSTHWDFAVIESPGCPACNSWSYNFRYHVGNSFADVLPTYPFYYFIETLLHSGVTSGCTISDYCPETNVSRQQMAKFICAAMKAKKPSSCTTSSCTGIFADVPGSNNFCPFIEALFNAGIVSGCSLSPLMYCPDAVIQRQAMAKFICLATEATEPGSCPTSLCAAVFADVSASNIFCSHIEGVYNANMVSGCQVSPLLYCPFANVNRAQMAKFLVNAFDFLLY